MTRAAGLPYDWRVHRLLPALLFLAASHKPVTLSVHLLVPCSGRATVRVKVPAGTQCLDATPFLTQADVESADVQKSSRGTPMILVTFRNEAAMRELQITRQNIGNYVAIVLNGRVVSTPMIAAASRLLYIDGDFKAQEAAALVDALNRQARGK